MSFREIIQPGNPTTPFLSLAGGVEFIRLAAKNLGLRVRIKGTIDREGVITLTAVTAKVLITCLVRDVAVLAMHTNARAAFRDPDPAKRKQALNDHLAVLRALELGNVTL